MRIFLLLCLLALSAAQEEDRAGIDLERYTVVDVFWQIIDKAENNTVGPDQLQTFYNRYDNKDSNPRTLNIYEDDYKSGDFSAVKDFLISTTSAIAYFKLQDIVDFFEEEDDFYERMTYEDMVAICLIGDWNADGHLNETEFKLSFQRVFRGANFAKLYVDFRPREGTSLYDDYLRYTDWMRIFDTFDVAGSGTLSADQFSTVWIIGGYGGDSQARAFHNLLDLERSGLVFREEWELIFYRIDYDEDSLLGLDELLSLDYWLNDGFLPLGITDAKKYRQEYLYDN